MARFKVQFLCSKMTKPELCKFIILFKVSIIDRLLMSVNQTHVGADLRYLLL